MNVCAFYMAIPIYSQRLRAERVPCYKSNARPILSPRRPISMKASPINGAFLALRFSGSFALFLVCLTVAVSDSKRVRSDTRGVSMYTGDYICALARRACVQLFLFMCPEHGRDVLSVREEKKSKAIVARLAISRTYVV